MIPYRVIVLNLYSSLAPPPAAPSRPGPSSSPSPLRSVDDLFGLDLVTTLRCPESGEEQVDSSHQYMMKCNIDQTVNNLFEGLQLALKEDREKSSDKLGRTVKWEGESRVARLPRYLTVQQVRFFYKREIQTKAKMLRAVAFPALLDVYPLCSPELKAQLDVPRAAEQEAREREVMEGRGGTKKAKLEVRGRGGRGGFHPSCIRSV